METLTFTTEMAVVMGLLAFTVFLFVSEIVRIDLAAVLVLVLVGLLSYLPGLGNLADVAQLFEGFASNAVISIIAVMIVGAGLDKTGIMNKVAALILKHGGKTEARILPIVSGTVGVISSFLQNVGAAALFLPVVSRISTRSGIPMSRLLMPMGFCAILGGTITMVGSSPLILLNDLILAANKTLPDTEQMEPFHLFSVTPIGLALVTTGILYFVLLGRYVLPLIDRNDASSGVSIKDYVRKLYGVNTDLFEIEISADSPLDGAVMAEVMRRHHVYILGSYYRGQRFLAPTVATTKITAPCRLAVLGEDREVSRLVTESNAKRLGDLEVFAEEYAPTNAGVAEVVVPPGSSLVGKTPIDLELRKVFGLSVLAIHRGETVLSLVETDDHEPTRIGHEPLRSGDTIVAFTKWDRLAKLTKDPDFVVVTSDFPREELRPHKVGWALLCFSIALSMILFTDVRLSLCLLTGAVGMMLSRVISIDEAYRSVGWNTVFLLASLIPLGQAVQNTGTAAWIAQQILIALDGWPIWSFQAGIAVLATVFSLVMSNVGATVLLVPLAVSIAAAAGANPAVFALTVAISTSNSFLIPTHQVNALIMGPAGYRVIDFVKSGGIMTVLFLITSLLMLNAFY